MKHFWALTVLFFGVEPQVLSVALPHDDGYAIYEHPGRMVRLPTGNRLSLYCVGAGKQTVILEAGFGGGAYAAWHELQPRLSAKYRTCSYDRAGYGFSELGNDLPRDIKHDVLDLHALLHAAGEHGPYILVGHSDGGHIIGAFTDLYPSEVSGLVFLDAAVLLEKPVAPLSGHASNIAPYQRQQLDEIKACLHRAQASTGALTPKPGDPCLSSDETSKLPAGMAHALGKIAARPDTWRAFLSEAEQHYLVRDSQWEESLLPHHWTELPIRVFTASVASLSDEASAPLYGLPASDHKAISEAREGRRYWEALQTRICELSPACKTYLIPTSEHLVQNVVPDQVVRSIEEIEAAKKLSGEFGGTSRGE